jgi:hypothetical protein
VNADGTYFSLLSTLNLSTYYSKGYLVNAYMKTREFGFASVELFSLFYLKSPPRLCEAINLAVQVYY